MSHFHLVIYPFSHYFSEKREMKIFHHKNLEIIGENLAIASNERKKIWAIFYGTLFNEEELKKEIKKAGFHFHSDSVAEVIALGFDAWQEKLFPKLNGHFSLLIFDEEEETCYAVRDHLGHKPLYWSSYGNHLFISTHLKPILDSGVVPQTPALDAMASYLYFGFVPQDFSMVEKINKLLPGHYLKSQLNRRWQILPYWSLSNLYAKRSPLSEEECVEKLGSFLEKSIHSLAEKKVILLSSASLGDRSLCYLASHLLLKEKISLINLDFGNEEIPGLETTTLSINAEQIFEALPSMVWELEEPLAHTECVGGYFQSQFAKKNGMFTFLSASGFDQILGDHNFVEEEHFESWIHKIARTPEWIRKSTLFLSSLFYPNLKYQILRNSDIDLKLIYYLDSIALFKGKNRKTVSPALYPYFIPEAFVQRFHQLSKVQGQFQPVLYFDCKTLLPDSLFFQQEKFFSHPKALTIYPFTQKDFLEFFIPIPDSLKCKNQTPAYLLNQLLKRSTEKKIEKSSTSHLFYQKMHKEPLCQQIFSLLQNSRLIDEGYLSSSWLKETLRYPHMVPYTFNELWSILILEIWFRLFISQPLKNSTPQLSTQELLSKKP